MKENIIITSIKTGGRYKLNGFKTYRIEQSVDIPADGFEMVIPNPNYETSSIISAGDKIEFNIGSDIVLEGYIDDTDLEYTTDSNDMRITGRDIMAVLLDNDANPTTYNNIGLTDYLGRALPQYGFTYHSADNTKFDKIVISPGETEYSIIERLCSDRNLTPIYLPNEKKLYCIKPVSSSTPIYTFSNTLSNAIKIKDCQITINNDIRNEVIVYGGDYENNKNIKGSYSDTSLKTKKRKILNDSEIENSSDAQKRAKEEFYNLNKDAFKIQITTNTKSPIYINRPARVHIAKMGLDVTLAVDSVTYSKSMSDGSLTHVTLKLMPGIGVSFKDNDIPKLPNL